MTHLHIKLVSGLECIYISEAGREDPKRGQIVRDKCLNWGFDGIWVGKGVS